MFNCLSEQTSIYIYNFLYVNDAYDYALGIMKIKCTGFLLLNFSSQIISPLFLSMPNRIHFKTKIISIRLNTGMEKEMPEYEEKF